MITWSATICWLKTAVDCCNICRVCPALVLKVWFEGLGNSSQKEDDRNSSNAGRERARKALVACTGGFGWNVYEFGKSDSWNLFSRFASIHNSGCNVIMTGIGRFSKCRGKYLGKRENSGNSFEVLNVYVYTAYKKFVVGKQIEYLSETIFVKGRPT